MRKLLLLLVILLSLSRVSVAQLMNGARGFPQPNDGTIGTVINGTAIVNSAGNAIAATTSNTAVPVYIVAGGAGTSGNAILVQSGIAICTMDSTIASGGGAYYVIQSTINNNQCHAQSASPLGGTWIIGFLASSTTSAGHTSVIIVDGFFAGVGTITGVTAGVGLSGGGNTGSITLNGEVPNTVSDPATNYCQRVLDLEVAFPGRAISAQNDGSGTVQDCLNIDLQTTASTSTLYIGGGGTGSIRTTVGFHLGDRDQIIGDNTGKGGTSPSANTGANYLTTSTFPTGLASGSGFTCTGTSGNAFISCTLSASAPYTLLIGPGEHFMLTSGAGDAHRYWFTNCGGSHAPTCATGSGNWYSIAPGATVAFNITPALFTSPSSATMGLLAPLWRLGENVATSPQDMLLKWGFINGDSMNGSTGAGIGVLLGAEPQENSRIEDIYIRDVSEGFVLYGAHRSGTHKNINVALTNGSVGCTTPGNGVPPTIPMELAPLNTTIDGFTFFVTPGGPCTPAQMTLGVIHITNTPIGTIGNGPLRIVNWHTEMNGTGTPNTGDGVLIDATSGSIELDNGSLCPPASGCLNGVHIASTFAGSLNMRNTWCNASGGTTNIVKDDVAGNTIPCSAALSKGSNYYTVTNDGTTVTASTDMSGCITSMTNGWCLYGRGWAHFTAGVIDNGFDVSGNGFGTTIESTGTNATTVVPIEANAPSGQTADLQDWDVNLVTQASISFNGTFTGQVPLGDLPAAPANTVLGNNSGSSATASFQTTISVTQVTANGFNSTASGGGGWASNQGAPNAMANTLTCPNCSTSIVENGVVSSVTQPYYQENQGLTWTGLEVGTGTTNATFSSTACTVSSGQVTSCPTPSSGGNYPAVPGCAITGTGAITSTATCTAVLSGSALASETITANGAGYTTANVVIGAVELMSSITAPTGGAGLPVMTSGNGFGTTTNPASGILNWNHGSAVYGTSYSTNGSGTTVPLATGPTITTLNVNGIETIAQNGGTFGQLYLNNIGVSDTNTVPSLVVTDNDTNCKTQPFMVAVCNAGSTSVDIATFGGASASSTTPLSYLQVLRNGSVQIGMIGNTQTPLIFTSDTSGSVSAQLISGQTYGSSKLTIPINTGSVAAATIAELGLAETWIGAQTFAGELITGTATKTANYTGNSTVDSGSLIIMNCSSACTYTLNGSPVNGYWGAVESIGSTVATVSLNSKNFNGASSVPVLISDQPMFFWSDGTNYFGEAPPVAGSNITLTPASNGLTITSAATTGSTLNSIISATAANTPLTNGNFLQTLGWSLTGSTDGLLLDESSASTGTGSIFGVTTSSGSTATPVTITQGALTSTQGTSGVAGLNINSTFNFATLNLPCFVCINITNTSSQGTSKSFATFGGTSGTTLESAIDVGGDFFTNGAYGGLINVNNVTFCGGAATGGCASQNNNGQEGMAGLIGGATSATGTSAKGGVGAVMGGPLTGTNTNTTTVQEGLVQLIQPFQSNGTVTTFLGVAMTSSAWEVTNCATSCTNAVGFALATQSTAHALASVVMEGSAVLTMENASTIGDYICAGSTTGGEGHDNGTTQCTAGQQWGFVAQNQGTITETSNTGGVSSAITLGSGIGGNVVIAIHFR